jgi:uncharacterized Zn finger protein (UPF0148 family)
MEDHEWVMTIRDQLAKENREGGEMKDSPCPLCKRPLSQRSDYVRCNPCGVNFLPGEDLDKDPRPERYRKMVAEARAAQKPKEAA